LGWSLRDLFVPNSRQCCPVSVISYSPAIVASREVGFGFPGCCISLLYLGLAAQDAENTFSALSSAWRQEDC
jgi:galactokinase